jgi:hypothetical protein
VSTRTGEEQVDFAVPGSPVQKDDSKNLIYCMPPTSTTGHLRTRSAFTSYVGLLQGQPVLPGNPDVRLLGRARRQRPAFDGSLAVSVHPPLLVCVFVQGFVRDPATGVDDNTLAYMQSTYTAHYTVNQQPVGIYTIHLAVGFISTLDFIRNLTDGGKF